MASVWYVGGSDRRVISKEDWASLGEDQETSTWDKFNGFSLPQDSFSPSEVEKLRQMGFQPDSPDGPRPGSAVVPNETGEVTQAQLAAAIAALANSYAPLWQASTAYAINAPVVLPNGKPAIRTVAGTSRAQFDATELALWTLTGGGLEKADADTLYAPKWKAQTAVIAGQVVVAPNGVSIARIANGTTRASYDATEAALWNPVVARSQQIDNATVGFAVTDEAGNTTWLMTTPTGDVHPVAASLIAVAVLPKLTGLATYGDSMTQGQQGVPTSWPQMLSDQLALPLYNPSRGGEASGDIAIRSGARTPELTLTGNEIPAATTPVVVTTIAPNTGHRNVTGNTSIGVFDGVLAGIPGTLKNDNGTWTFTRTTSGATAVPVPPATKFYSQGGRDFRRALHIFWPGRNNPGATQILADIANMLTLVATDPKKYLVLSLLNNSAETSGTTGYDNIIAINAALSSAHGSNYVDLRTYLVNNGLAAAGITPTTQDTADIAAGVVPTSLRHDEQHPNHAGRIVIANYLKQVITDKKWTVTR